jgi:hypothetical protein
MSEESFKGLIPTIMEMQPATVEYNPEKYWAEHTLADFWKDIVEMDEKEREWKRKTNWKPEYILTKYEAEEMPLYWLEWLGNSYRVLCGLEVYEIVKKREAEALPPP